MALPNGGVLTDCGELMRASRAVGAVDKHSRYAIGDKIDGVTGTTMKSAFEDIQLNSLLKIDAIIDVVRIYVRTAYWSGSSFMCLNRKL